MIEQTDIFVPVLSMLVLTMLVWVYMFAKRIPFITSHFKGEVVTPQALQARSPASVSNPSDNLKNLFEIPVIFYVLCLYLFVVAQVDNTYLLLAWVFVFFRVLHSIVHCTFNTVMIRFVLYLMATVAVWVILIRALFAFF